jgi:hypothetical protein
MNALLLAHVGGGLVAIIAGQHHLRGGGASGERKA